jgi:hypothetical protein
MTSNWKGVPLGLAVEACDKHQNAQCTINAVTKETSEMDFKALTLTSLSILHD